MGMLTFFGGRAGITYFVLPSDCDTLRKPFPDQVSERGQRPQGPLEPTCALHFGASAPIKRRWKCIGMVPRGRDRGYKGGLR